MIETLLAGKKETQTAPRQIAKKTQRWLHVISHLDPKYGGLSSAVPALAAALREKEGLDVRLAAFCHPNEREIPAGLDAKQVHFWRITRHLEPKAKDRLREEIQRVHGIHIHGLWEASTALTCRMAREAGKPYVLSAHGMLEPWALANKRWRKRIYAALIEKRNVARAARLHALTAAEADQYRTFGAHGPVEIIPNAIQVPSEINPELFLRRYPELRGKRIILFLSRLHSKKGLDLLMEAWTHVGPAYPEACLVLAGPDSEGVQARLTQVVVEKRLDTQVMFTGMLEGAMKWSALQAAECFVLPSYSEGLSMALLEAMGMGLPVLATHACNMPEITKVGAGWEIEPSAELLRGTLHAVLARQPEENWAMGQNGAQLVRERYGFTKVAAQTAAMYADVLQEQTTAEDCWTEAK